MKTTILRRRASYGRAFLLVLLAGTLAACSSGIGQHFATYRHLRAYAKENRAQRDLSRERASENGLYRATIAPQPAAIPLNQLHAWTLHVEGPGASALDGATITVDGGMPEHGHGLPTKPQVTRALSGGAYLVEGMKFQMPGWWVVRFQIASPAGTDTVTFNLEL
jgi:hypothetical protein